MGHQSRQENVRHGSALVAEPLGDLGERTPGAVCGVDDGLNRHSRCGNTGHPVCPPPDAVPQNPGQGDFDEPEDRRVDELDGEQGSRARPNGCHIVFTPGLDGHGETSFCLSNPILRLERTPTTEAEVSGGVVGDQPCERTRLLGAGAKPRGA